MRIEGRKMIKVTIWNEYIHERELPEIASVYPEGIHRQIGAFLKEDKDLLIRYATLDEPECGLSEEVLSDTDVLIYWAHCAHDRVSDEVAARVCEHIQRGMGFIGLHSAHFCKILKRILGTTMTLSWKDDDSEKLYVTCPSHPIAAGVAPMIELPHEELYGEYFDIPKPDDVIFTGWFKSGAVFRSGVTFTRGNGRIFYFQPGHESYPIYYNPEIQKIIRNAVHWVYSENKLTSVRDNIQIG